MAEVKAGESDQAVENFRCALKKFQDYIAYLETIPQGKRTMKQNGLVAEYGTMKNSRKRLKIFAGG